MVSMSVTLVHRVVGKIWKRNKKMTIREEVYFLGLLLGVILAIWNEEVTWYEFSKGTVADRRDKADQLHDRVFKLESKPRGGTDDKFFPNSKAPGSDFIDYDARTLYLLVRDDDPVGGGRLRWTPTFQLRLVITRNDSVSLDSAGLIEVLGRLLALPRFYFVWSGVFPSTADEFVILEVEIRCVNTTTMESCFGALDFNYSANLLRTSFYHGSLSLILNCTVYAIELNHSSFQISHGETRSKRQTKNDNSISYLMPYKVVACCFVDNLITLEHAFNIKVTVYDYRGNVVIKIPDGHEWTVVATLSSWPSSGQGMASFIGDKEAIVSKGVATFANLTFTEPGDHYQIQFTLMDNGQPMRLVRRFTTASLTVIDRPFELVLSSSGPPYHAIESQTLSPFPVITIEDKLTGTPAKEKYLKKYKWKAVASLKYEFYDGQLSGETHRDNEGNKIAFPSLIITQWGLWFYLTIKAYTVPYSGRNYTLDIGPFDVRPVARTDDPIVTYTTKMSLNFVIEADFREIFPNLRRFYVYFINFFCKKYDKVSWLNMTAVPGSIVATSEIIGSPNQLNETLTMLDSHRDQKISYIPGRNWRFKRAATNDAKGTEDAAKKKKEGQGSLPLAWIAAIVINGVLVFLFILFVVYCYCRSKRKSQQPEQEDPYGRHYGGPNERSYNEKAASNPHQRGRMPGTERAALISTGAQRGVEPRSVFTIEDERQRLRDEEDLEDYEPDRYSSPIDRHEQPNRPESRPISSPPYYYDDEREHLPTEVKSKGTVTDELDDDLEEEYQKRLQQYDDYVDDPRSPGANVPSSPAPGYKSASPIPYTRQTTPPAPRSPTPPPAPPPAPQSPEPVTATFETEEVRSVTRNLSREGFYNPDPMDQPAVNTIVPMPVPLNDPTGEAWQAPQKSRVDVAPEEKQPQMFDVFVLKEGSTVKSKKGQIPLNLDAPMTLTHLRSMLNSVQDSKIKAVTKKKYTFMTDDLRGVDFPEGALLVKNVYPSGAIYLKLVDNEWQAPKKKEKTAPTVEPQPVPKTYTVNIYRGDRGVKEFVGEISLPEAGYLTLTHLRSTLCKAPLNIEGLAWKDYVFMSENLEDVSAPEGALLVDLLYPNQEIIFRFVNDELQESTNKKPRNQTGVTAAPVPVKNGDFKKKDYAYVGPLGMCSSAECEKPARLKCLDCGQVGYCTTRHMKEDQFTHKRLCFKPQWKH